MRSAAIVSLLVAALPRLAAAQAAPPGTSAGTAGDLPADPYAAQPAPQPPPQATPASQPQAAPATANPALDEFNRRFIGFAFDPREYAQPRYRSRAIRPSVTFMDRAERRPFDSVGKFLEAVGETERAARWQKREYVHYGLLIPGAASLAAGAVVLAIAVYYGNQAEQVCVRPAAGGGCDEYNYVTHYSTPALAAGGTLVGVGVVAMILGYQLRHKVTVDEAVQMAERYNRKLLRSLGLDVVEGRRAPLHLSLLPAAGPQGAGLTLRASF